MEAVKDALRDGVNERGVLPDEVSYKPVTHPEHNSSRICSLRALSKVEVKTRNVSDFRQEFEGRAERSRNTLVCRTDASRVAPSLPQGVSNKFDKRCTGRSSPKNAKRKNATRREKCTSTSLKLTAHHWAIMEMEYGKRCCFWLLLAHPTGASGRWKWRDTQSCEIHATCER